jgi:hypothetical protein
MQLQNKTTERNMNGYGRPVIIQLIGRVFFCPYPELLGDFGRRDNCRLLLSNSIRHIAFGFVAGLVES